MKLTKLIIAALLSGYVLTACSNEPETIYIQGSPVENVDNGGSVAGFYILNEGNMGSNKCTLDYFDYATKSYYRNIYAERNPQAILELGDSGNDIAVYRNRLYIVVTGSNKVEVLDAATAIRIGQVDINSPRSLAFDGDFMYVSSFVGGTDKNGSVVKVNVNDMKINSKCSVGLGPEEMVITGGKLYVVNSTDFTSYDNRISVIDIATFKVVSSIEAGLNLRHLHLDAFGNMWAIAQGNYYDVAPSLILLKKTGSEYVKIEEYKIPCSNFAFASDVMYYYASTYGVSGTTNSYSKVGIDASGQVGAPGSFITDGTAVDIESPYCIAVQPSNGTILITDAKNYTSSGELRCYSQAGKLLWKTTTGDIPGHIAFIMK